MTEQWCVRWYHRSTAQGGLGWACRQANFPTRDAAEEAFAFRRAPDRTFRIELLKFESKWIVWKENIRGRVHVFRTE